MARTPPHIAHEIVPDSNVESSNSDVDELEEDEWMDLFTHPDNTPYSFMFHSSLNRYTEERAETTEMIQVLGFFNFIMLLVLISSSRHTEAS